MFSAAIGLLAAATSAHSNEGAHMFVLTRDGTELVCADLIEASPIVESNARQWTLGMWSGLNMAFGVTGHPQTVGKNTTPNGVYGELKLMCSKNPSMQLPHAVRDVYVRVRDSGR